VVLAAPISVATSLGTTGFNRFDISAFSDGGLVLAWSEFDNVAGTYEVNTGLLEVQFDPISNAWAVSSAAPVHLVASVAGTSDQPQVKVQTNSTDDFVIVWNDAAGLKTRHFDRSGTGIIAERLVSGLDFSESLSRPWNLNISAGPARDYLITGISQSVNTVHAYWEYMVRSLTTDPGTEFVPNVSNLPVGSYTLYAVDSVAQQVVGTFNVEIIDPPPAAPEPPVIEGVIDDDLTPGDGITTDTTLRIFGSAQPLSTVVVYFDGVSLGSTIAAGTGSWTLDNTATSLPAGTHTLMSTPHSCNSKREYSEVNQR